MGDDNPQYILAEIEHHVKRLQVLRSEQKSIRNRFSLLILCMMLIFGWVLYTKIQMIQTKNLARDVVQSKALQDQIFKNISQVSDVLIPVVQRNITHQIMKDTSLLRFIQGEVNAFIDVARYNLRLQLNPMYIALVVKLKRHIYQAFPEFQDHAKVEKAVDNLIGISGPRLQSVLQDKFEEHVKSLLNMFQLVKNLKDPEFKKMASYEEAVLGITLQLFGELLREKGEDKREVTHG